MTLHTYTPQPMSLPSMNFLHLTVTEIQPGQTISRRPTDRPPSRPPAHPDTMGENNTPTALKGCGVKKRHTSCSSLGWGNWSSCDGCSNYSLNNIVNKQDVHKPTAVSGMSVHVPTNTCSRAQMFHCLHTVRDSSTIQM